MRVSAEETVSQGFEGRYFRRNPDVIARRIAGELFLVPLRGKIADLQRIFSLSPVGEFIWEMLDGHHETGHLREAVEGRFAVDGSIAEADLQEFIGQLLQADLVSG